METPQEQLAPVSPPRRRLPENPLTLAWAALCVPLAVLVVCGVWGMVSLRTSEDEARAEAMGAVAASLAEATGVLIRSEELSRIRTLMSEAAKRPGIGRAAVLLPDGRAIADSETGNIKASLRDIAGQTPSPTGSPPGLTEFTGVRSVAKVPTGEGEVYIVVAAGEWAGGTPGGLAVGVFTLVGLWVGGVLLRRAMPAMRALNAVRDALIAVHEGEGDMAALAVSPAWGAEGWAWNKLLSDRREMETRLLERQIETATTSLGSGNAVLEGACDAVPQGLIVLSEEAEVRYANGAGSLLVGRHRDEMTGNAIGALGLDPRVVDLVQTVVVRGEKRRGSVEIERGTGTDRSLLRFTCIRVNQGAGGLLMGEDVTQQRVADQARESFVAQATHELRSPLTSIRMHLESLQEDGEIDPAMLGASLNVLNLETRRLERMVSEMLNVAEIEAGTMKLHEDDVRLSPLFEDLAADFKMPAEEKDITLEFTLPPKLPVIRGDKEKLAAVLHNLIGNAVKYTPAGGSVRVEAEIDDASLLVRVRDSGIGIAPDELDKVFQKFYRSHDRRVAKITGTGLGLAIAREMARLHGGDVSVESVLDQGSTFTLRLPLRMPAAKAA